MALPQQSDVQMKHILEASSTVILRRWGMCNAPTLMDPFETATLSDCKQQKYSETLILHSLNVCFPLIYATN
jgi:hypothetical protein